MRSTFCIKRHTFLQSSIDAAHISYENCYQYEDKQRNISKTNQYSHKDDICDTAEDVPWQRIHQSQPVVEICGQKWSELIKHEKDGSIYVPNGIKKKTPLISRAYIYIYRHIECTDEQTFEGQISFAENKMLWYVIKKRITRLPEKRQKTEFFFF